MQLPPPDRAVAVAAAAAPRPSGSAPVEAVQVHTSPFRSHAAAWMPRGRVAARRDHNFVQCRPPHAWMVCV